jgi:plasmid maintenance system antidote protein VapI
VEDVGADAIVRPASEASVLGPGEISETEFMEPMGISAYALAKALDFPATTTTVVAAISATGEFR